MSSLPPPEREPASESAPSSADPDTEAGSEPAHSSERRTYKRITDPRELRALSHPLRIRLMIELSARGQATVTQLANAVGEPVNRVSYHLRQLAKYGHIGEAPELARDRRDRWWRDLYPDGIDWSSDELRATPAGRKVVRDREEAWGDVLAGIRAALRTYEPGPGRLFCHDWFLRVTPEQFRQFDREYIKLCQRWRDRVHQDVATEGDDPERRTYAIFIFGFPAEIFGGDTAVEERAEP